MAEEDTELPVPRNEEEEDDIVTPVDPAVWDVVRVVIGFEETIYRLKVPTFTGKESVEQFIQNFQNLRNFARWPPRMALLKLRTVLTDKAKPYGGELTLPVSLLLCGPVLAAPPWIRSPPRLPHSAGR